MGSREQLEDERHEELKNGLAGIHERLDALNGRTRTLESDVAVLKWAHRLTGAVASILGGWWLTKG